MDKTYIPINRYQAEHKVIQKCNSDISSKLSITLPCKFIHMNLNKTSNKLTSINFRILVVCGKRKVTKKEKDEKPNTSSELSNDTCIFAYFFHILSFTYTFYTYKTIKGSTHEIRVKHLKLKDVTKRKKFPI